MTTQTDAETAPATPAPAGESDQARAERLYEEGQQIYGPGPRAGLFGPPASFLTSGGSTASRWPDAAFSSTGGGQGGAEFEDLATLRRFAEQVCALGEGSDFTQIIRACAGLPDMVRDLGGDMNKAAAELADAAIAVARDGEALRDQAAQVARLSADMSGA